MKKCPIVHKKKRRKPMSERLPTLAWKREDAQRVLELEKEYHAKRGDKAVIVRFPDPKLDYEVVKRFSSSIESVHFQQPAAPRSCIVHLKKGSDVKQVVEELNKTHFGQGLLSAEPKRDEIEDEELAVEDIDPYTLYIGNLPSDVNVDEVKEMFNTAKKVDVGYAQKMKVTRYGFARYTNVDNAIEAYKRNFNAIYNSRSIIVRFRRNNRSIGLDGDRKSRKKEDRKQLGLIKVKSISEELSTEHENVAYENDSDEGEDEVEDTKSGVFDYAHNMMDNWLSDDMYETDDNEEEPLPNLTGMIKHEPDDEAGHEFLRPEDDDIEPTDKNTRNTNIPSPGKFTENYDKTSKQKQRGNNENIRKGSDENRNSFASDPNGSFRESDYWQKIRQRELNEREEKPDIQSLDPPPSPGPSPAPSPAPTPTVPPITSYGLVPMILPKEEDDEELETDIVGEDEGGLGTFGSAFEQEEDVDAAFENAWNEMESTET